MNDTQGNPPTEGRPTGGRLVPQGRNLPAARDPYGSVGAYPIGAGEAPMEGGLDLLEYWRILNKRKWLIGGIAGAFLVFGR